MLLPLLGVFATGFLMLAVNIPMAAINTGLNNFLSSLSGSSAVLLGLLVGGMMAVDMGGPVNKAAYVFGTGTLAATVTSGGSVVMAAVMAAGMVPPLAVFVATLLFKDKFTLTLDYFKDTRDGIFQERKQIPDYVGLIQMPYGNIGRMKSWGADGNMEFYQQIGKDAHVILRSNFTLSKNKILNWEDTKKPYTYLENNGYANNVQRGFVAMGLFKDQQDVEMSPTQFGTVRPGDIKYRDINGDGKITDDDKVPLFAYSGVPQLM